jgi:RecB family exonuclease
VLSTGSGQWNNRQLIYWKCPPLFSPYDTTGTSVVPHIFRLQAARRVSPSSSSSAAADSLETQPAIPAPQKRRASTSATVQEDDDADPSKVAVVTPPPKSIKPRPSSVYYGPRATTAPLAPRELLPNDNKASQDASVDEDEYIVLSRTPINVTTAVEEETLPALLNPFDLLPTDPVTGQRFIPTPKALSPSSIKEFQSCPQSFFFQYILGLRQPTKPALAKGSMCHAALERLFDLEPPERSLSVLQNLFRTAWAEQRLTDTYRILFEDEVVVEEEAATGTRIQERRRYIQRERRWGQEGLQLLQQYWQAEDAASIGRPNPVQREVWVSAQLAVDGPSGAAAGDREHDTGEEAATTGTLAATPKFLVRGIVDRLDMVQDTQDKSQVALRLIDYKTGAAPELKYSAAMNEKIQKEALDQLLIYALLLRDQHQKKTHVLPLRYLRLFYLTSSAQRAVYWDLDLGATVEERRVLLDGVHAALAQVYRDLVALLAQQDPRAFTGCTRSFCYCHACRPKFQPGTVWEPRDESSE